MSMQAQSKRRNKLKEGNEERNSGAIGWEKLKIKKKKTIAKKRKEKRRRRTHEL